jgi:hypothetical protein
MSKSYNHAYDLARFICFNPRISYRYDLIHAKAEC